MNIDCRPFQRAANQLIAKFSARPPNQIIGPRNHEDAYLQRWYLMRNKRRASLYLHRFGLSDGDIPHDHPWHSISLILKGCYAELGTTAAQCRTYRPGDFVFRRALFTHRIVLPEGPVWTLLLTGPKIRDWGFLTPTGWVHWRTFLSLGKGA